MDPEKRYPAQFEDIDTIITGSDGNDYVVDVDLKDGIKKWFLYLPQDNHVIIYDGKNLPKEDAIICKPKDTVEKPAKEENKKKSNKYQQFLSEMTEKLKISEPNLSGKERNEKVRLLWSQLKNA